MMMKMMNMGVNLDDVRNLAYKKWEESGYEHGHDMDHWMKAMEEIMAKAITKKPAAKKPAAKKTVAKKAVAKKPAAKKPVAKKTVKKK
jgi:hypothetical protein